MVLKFQCFWQPTHVKLNNLPVALVGKNLLICAILQEFFKLCLIAWSQSPAF